MSDKQVLDERVLMLTCTAAAAQTALFRVNDDLTMPHSDILNLVDWWVIYHELATWKIETIQTIYKLSEKDLKKIMTEMMSFAWVMFHYERCRKIMLNMDLSENWNLINPMIWDWCHAIKSGYSKLVHCGRDVVDTNPLHEPGMVEVLVTGRKWDASKTQQVHHPIWEGGVQTTTSSFTIPQMKKLIVQDLSRLCDALKQTFKTFYDVLLKRGAPTSTHQKAEEERENVMQMLYDLRRNTRALKAIVKAREQELIFALREKSKKASVWIQEAQQHLRRIEDVQLILRLVSCEVPLAGAVGFKGVHILAQNLLILMQQ